MTFDVTYARHILPTLLSASIVTFEATVLGFILALGGGLVLALMRVSSVRGLARLAGWYIQGVRNTPFIIQLFFLFYVLPQYGVRLDALTTGIIGLGLHFSSFTAEVYRAGIEGVPRGQWEAAVALNLSTRRTWWRIILPQAVVPIIPPLGNYLVGMFKDSAILATISVTELLGAGLSEASLSFRYLEPLSIVGAVYLVFSLAGAAATRGLESVLARRYA
jgi:polar amino acid transport system permease protein